MCGLKRKCGQGDIHMRFSATVSLPTNVDLIPCRARVLQVQYASHTSLLRVVTQSLCEFALTPTPARGFRHYAESLVVWI